MMQGGSEASRSRVSSGDAHPAGSNAVRRDAVLPDDAHPAQRCSTACRAASVRPASMHIMLETRADQSDHP